MDIGAWNADYLWRAEYGPLIPRQLLFFAEDVFGNQFCLNGSHVCLFCAETGELTAMADSVLGWAEALMRDWDYITGYSFAHEWQLARDALRENERLIPKIPFVVGGGRALDNLYAGDAAEAMRFRGSLAKQIAALPDGTPVTLKIT